MLDRFEIKGPNGRHLCLVLEALGPSINPDILSPYGVWLIAKHLVESVADAHNLGVVHGGELLIHKQLVCEDRAQLF